MNTFCFGIVRRLYRYERYSNENTGAEIMRIRELFVCRYSEASTRLNNNQLITKGTGIKAMRAPHTKEGEGLKQQGCIP